MTAPPLTYREYAYFSVSGPGTHEDVTKALGVKPTECWNVGDICARTGQPRRFMAWRLSSGLDDTSPLASHIEQLLLVLCTRADEIRGLWTDYDLTLQCVGYFPETGHGAHFNREVLRQLANLGLALDLDFYHVSDHGHEL